MEENTCHHHTHSDPPSFFKCRHHPTYLPTPPQLTPPRGPCRMREGQGQGQVQVITLSFHGSMVLYPTGRRRRSTNSVPHFIIYCITHFCQPRNKNVSALNIACPPQLRRARPPSLIHACSRPSHHHSTPAIALALAGRAVDGP